MTAYTRANAAMTEEISHVTLTGDQAAEWKAWQKSKTSENSTSISTQGPVAAPATHFGNFANYACVGEGTQAQALASSYHPHLDWIIDSGASKYVTGTFDTFASYTPYTHLETIQMADGTSQPIKGVGSVGCTPHITLRYVLHVPSFPVNLLSVSSIIDQFKCTVLFDEDSCVFQEKRTGKRIGTGVWRNGLWYIGKEDVALALEGGPKGVEEDILLHHRRLGHPSFQNMSKMYGELFNKIDKRKLVCDACELGKHTRSSYRPSGVRSCEPFILIHSDVWGPCPVTSLSGVKWFVTFIDCFTCMTWIYMMKNKNEVIRCFQDFHKMVSTQFGKKVHILRSDNGTEYINKEFAVYLSEQGMLHQTTCPGTPSLTGGSTLSYVLDECTKISME